MKTKFIISLSILLSLTLSPTAQALTMQEILQGYDNPKGPTSPAASQGGQVLGATTNGLVGYWNFDEGSGTTAADSSGNNNTATLTNGPTWTAGKVGSGAVSFDGVNDYVQTSSFPIGSVNFTVSMWVKHNGSGGRVFRYASGADQMIISVDSGLNFYRNGWLPSAGSGLNNGAWHHITITYNSSNVIRYLDGNVLAINAKTFDISGLTPSVFISDSANSFPGMVDEVRVYNRALSTSEIMDIYTADSGTLPPSPPPPAPLPSPSPMPSPNPSPTPPPPSFSPSIVTAASCSQADVQMAVDQAGDDVSSVHVPAGTCTWTGTVTVNKGMILQGAGIDQTVIVDDATSPAFIINTQAGKSFRLTGFTFQRTATNKTGSMLATIYINGTTNLFRMDHNKVDHTQSPTAIRGVMFEHGYSNITGVIDHNTFLSGFGSLNGALDLHHGGWGGKTNGDGAWIEPAQWGTDKFLFIEDNVFDGRQTGDVSQTIADTYDGTRAVFRYNTIYDRSGGGASHGTESGGRHRGPRAFENYRNTYIATGQSLLRGLGVYRGGGILAWGNNLSYFGALWALRNNRSGVNFYWGASDGTNPFDLNDRENDGSIKIYGSGTHTGASGSPTLTDFTKNWTANQWSEGGYSVRVCPGLTPVQCANSWAWGVAKGRGSWIVSNTSNTLTVGRVTNDDAPVFNNGDTYIITRATKVFDAMGRGAGKLMIGDTPTCPTCSSLGLEQEDEPSYQWDNKYCSSAPGCTPTLPAKINAVAKISNGKITGLDSLTTPHVLEDRDLFQFTASFDGTSGVGTGSFSSRPPTCTPGVAYWATDEGEWDSTHSGADGQLYKCTSTNTWSLYYIPYPYPHSLITGAAVNITPIPPPPPTPTPTPTPSPSPNPNPTPTPQPTPTPTPPSPSPSPSPSPTPTPNPTPSVPTPAPVPSPIPNLQSPASNLKLINAKGTYYLIIDNTRHGITNPGMLTSYGLTFAMGKPATAEDLKLPEGTLLLPQDGILAKTKDDKTVWLISNNQRRGFTSSSVFIGLGFKFNQVLIITAPELIKLPTGANLDNANAVHPEGVDINLSGTIYWVHNNTLYPYPSLQVYNSWRVPNDFSRVLPANAADKALPKGGVVEGRRVE